MASQLLKVLPNHIDVILKLLLINWIHECNNTMTDIFPTNANPVEVSDAYTPRVSSLIMLNIVCTRRFNRKYMERPYGTFDKDRKIG